MISNETVQDYYKSALKDIEGLKKIYPFTSYVLQPSLVPKPITIRTVAAEKKLIELTSAKEQDFLGLYSKALDIIVPFNYKEIGCQVYGGKWINVDRIPDHDQHFYTRNSEGNLLLCVGVPDSFAHMENVILENVRTANRMLIAYELFLTGKTAKLELRAYSHGEKGRNEYNDERKKHHKQ